MKKSAVIVAGGKGSRMNSEIPKQFLLISGRPILMHTIEAFYMYDSAIQITVVLPKDQFEFWNDQIQEYDFEIKHLMVEGGDSRYESVKNGLNTVNEGIVAIHDGARPLVSQKIISEAFIIANQKGNAITSLDMKDSIRKMDENSSKSVDRSKYKIIQTPQTFKVELIKTAFEQTQNSSLFTDDASVLEYVGHSINLSEGSYENIKITSPEDLLIAEAILNSRQ
ncbi:2-C-methyl-D-erythritol 4-phosphate cytidylyltransferase [Reichenbachiella versicolor]|uniref:2-C-methyl-D-erythritol 4-phosphate cytidylyltransferase n=1 Tax=Reichenbachiella versicolor TaxID=1821036 RepID=UPI000D6E1D49|nr:2-C-methyl-D-erythritol 4-phosphate cytidylyltransferase [Reichenbachiella versicolor]